MRKIPQPVDYDTAKSLLAYDPDSGEITWRKGNRRVKPGDLAGALTHDGYITVTINGTKIRGQYLAWLLHYGEWPRSPVRMKSAIGIDPSNEAQRAGRSDLRIDNLVLADEVLSDSPSAMRYRHYVSERRRIHNIYARDLASRTLSSHYNVIYDQTHDRWLLKELFSPDEERSPFFEQRCRDAAVLSTYPDIESAENAAIELLVNRDFVCDRLTGREKLPPSLPAGLGDATAGPLGPTLADIRDKLAYAPGDGILIWRKGPKRYQDAAIPTTGRTSYVPYLTWRLPAHSLAFFMGKGVWPPRGTIWPHDGNWRNIRLNNLVYKHHAMTTPYPLETADA